MLFVRSAQMAKGSRGMENHASIALTATRKAAALVPVNSLSVTDETALSPSTTTDAEFPTGGQYIRTV